MPLKLSPGTPLPVLAVTPRHRFQCCAIATQSRSPWRLRPLRLVMKLLLLAGGQNAALLVSTVNNHLSVRYRRRQIAVAADALAVYAGQPLLLVKFTPRCRCWSRHALRLLVPPPNTPVMPSPATPYPRLFMPARDHSIPVYVATPRQACRWSLWLIRRCPTYC